MVWVRAGIDVLGLGTPAMPVGDSQSVEKQGGMRTALMHSIDIVYSAREHQTRMSTWYGTQKMQSSTRSDHKQLRPRREGQEIQAGREAKGFWKTYLTQHQLLLGR